MNLNEMTMNELKELAMSRGIYVKGLRKKAELIDAIEQAQQEAPAEISEEAPVYESDVNETVEAEEVTVLEDGTVVKNVLNVSDLKEVYKRDNMTNSVVVDWRGLKIGVNPSLSLKGMLDFVSYVVESVFDDDGTYKPSYYDFIVKYALMEYYTSFYFGDDDINEVYDMLYCTDVVGAVLEVINKGQLKEMLDSIDNSIKHRLDVDTATNRDAMIQLMNDVSNLTETTKEAFDGLSPEEISKFVSAVNEEALTDPKKIVSVYKELQEEE